MGSPQGSYNVGIVGAGIAGLAAAIALGRLNYKVTVYEKSKFSNETGAALLMAPSASRILRAWGLKLPDGPGDGGKSADGGGTSMEWIRSWDPRSVKGVPSAMDSFMDSATRYGSPYVSYHRADLHAELQRLAIAAGAKIILGAEVVDLDCQAGRMTINAIETNQVETIEKDLIVVANGVKSALASIIAGRDLPLIEGSHCIYRSLIPIERIRKDEDASKLFPDGRTSGQTLAIDRGRSAIAYPCRNGQVMNVAIQGSRDVQLFGDDWQTPASNDEVVDLLEGFDESWLALIRLSDDIKTYKHAIRAPVTSFVNGKALMIGDAAHPMTPGEINPMCPYDSNVDVYSDAALAAGGATSLEDAAALEVLLAGIPEKQGDDSLSERMRLWELLRLPRDNTIQILSNAQFAPKLASALSPAIRPFLKMELPNQMLLGQVRNTREFLNYYDVFAAAKRALHWWEEKRTMGYSLQTSPIHALEEDNAVVHFGPTGDAQD